MTAAPTDLDVPCPPAPADAAGAAVPPARPPAVPGTLLAVRRPFDAIEPATWDALAAAIAVGHPVRALGFHRAWWDAYGANAHDQTLVVVDPAGVDPDAPGRDRPAHAPPRGGARRRDPPDPPARRPARAAHAGGADRQGRLLRRLLPRRLRHAPRRARPTSRPWPTRSPKPLPPPGTPTTRATRRPGTWSTSAAFAAATPPSTRWPRRSAPGRAPGWTVIREREDVCPVVTLAAGAGLRGLPRDARQEGAPRGPAQDPPRRGRRRGPPGALARTRSPTSRRSSTSTRSAGAPTGSSRRPPAATQSRTFFRRLFERLGDRTGRSSSTS